MIIDCSTNESASDEEGDDATLQPFGPEPAGNSAEPTLLLPYSLAAGTPSLVLGGVVTYFLPHYVHIPLHRLWAFATLQDELSPSEQAHILDCDDCRISLQTCLKLENFGAVLKELQPEDDGQAA